MIINYRASVFDEIYLQLRREQLYEVLTLETKIKERSTSPSF